MDGVATYIHYAALGYSKQVLFEGIEVDWVLTEQKNNCIQRLNEWGLLWLVSVIITHSLNGWIPGIPEYGYVMC